MADTFKPGEIVDIAIKGVRVLAQREDGTVIVQCDDNSDGWRLPPQAAIVRVAPAEWPPREGDLWRDRHGDVWFAADLAYPDEGEPEKIMMIYARQDFQLHPSVANERHGPLTLVHRESAAEAETAATR